MAGPNQRIQHSVMELYRAFGCTVLRFNEGRRTQISNGWPDLYVFCPRREVTWAHEVKAPKEPQSEGQQAMQELFKSCGLAYVIGGPNEAREHLDLLRLTADL